MTVNYNFKKGVDLPAWHWVTPFPAGASNHGSACAYDGNRYIYWAIQFGSTTAASTTQLWRFDTWSNGWQYLVSLTNSYTGLDLELDSVRNVIYVINGNATNTWQVFNLNKTAVTVVNQSIPAFSLATVSLTLPATATTGSSLSSPDDLSIPAQIDTGTADSTGQTTTAIRATDATGTFGSGMVGLQFRATSGAQANQARTITAVTDKNNLTVAPALPAALAANDTFVIEMPSDPVTAGTTTTLTDSTAAWPTNAYANSDVIIVSGTGAGQRRRIASNTATVLTLASAVTGNARTGAFATAPDATSVYRIVPSSDFLYFQAGGGTGLWRLDVTQTTGTAWAAVASLPAATGGGANTFFPYSYAPFSIVCLRGAGTPNLYQYSIGANTWATLATYAGSETFNTGATATVMHGKRKLFIQKDGSTRCYVFNMLTGELEPAGVMPYANPGTYDGKRAKFVRTPDGVEWIYLLRAGGQEYYRVPLEWLA